MKKEVLAAILIISFSTAAIALNETVPQPGQGQADAAASAVLKKKTFMQVGAVEKAEGDKYVMRKTETRYEFYLDEKTKIFLRTESSADALMDKNYLVIKGPKNRKVVLANSVYIYDSKEAYENSSDKKEDNPEAWKKVFSAVLEGTIKQKNPLIIRLSDGSEYAVSYDEDTYWILTKPADKSEIKAGERIRLFFDKLYSIRYKNYPVKVIVDRVKSGF
jgi:hypothetical protein